MIGNYSAVFFPFFPPFNTPLVEAIENGGRNFPSPLLLVSRKPFFFPFFPFRFGRWTWEKRGVSPFFFSLTNLRPLSSFSLTAFWPKKTKNPSLFQWAAARALPLSPSYNPCGSSLAGLCLPFCFPLSFFFFPKCNAVPLPFPCLCITLKF